MLKTNDVHNVTGRAISDFWETAKWGYALLIVWGLLLLIVTTFMLFRDLSRGC